MGDEGVDLGLLRAGVVTEIDRDLVADLRIIGERLDGQLMKFRVACRNDASAPLL